MSTAAPQPGPTPNSSSSPSSSDTSLSAAEHLPDDPVLLKRMILELLATLQQERRDHDALRQRLDLLLRRLYGPRGERFDPNQPSLFPELTTPTADETTASRPGDDEASQAKRARPHGRRVLPDHLPRETRHYELTPAERLCPDCGQQRIDIGVDHSEQLEYEPAALKVIEHIVHKYACPCCSKPTKPEPATPEPATPELATPELATPELATPELATPELATPEPETPEPETPSAPMPVAEVPDASTVSVATVSVAAADPTGTAVADTPLSTPMLRPGVVVAAPRPAAPITKGLPGPGLLAHLIVSKYVDHLPLHRLERIYERHGLVLPRSTTCDWLAACAKLLQPLYDLMVTAVLQSRSLHTDDTIVKNQKPPPACTDLGRMWCYLGDAAHPFHVFDFTPNRKRDGPQTFLATYQGYLHADAFSGYDALYLPSAAGGSAGIIEVACNAHARRKFYDARTTDAARSHQALAYYGQLYEIERRAKELQLGDAGRLALRQDLAVPILTQMHSWLRAQSDAVLPKSPLGEALGYALRNWTALTRYTEAGYLAIDNNVAEREMKRIAIGRKNWLFVGSVAGGHTAAVHISFTSTCARLGIEPWSFLRDVLTRLPSLPPVALPELLPDRWLAARTSTPTTP